MFPGLSTKISEESLASAASISPTKDLVRLTGNTTLATIVPPLQGGFSSVIFVVPVDAAVSTTTTDNIAAAVAMPQSRITVLTYSKVTGKWYPGAIS